MNQSPKEFYELYKELRSALFNLFTQIYGEYDIDQAWREFQVLDPEDERETIVDEDSEADYSGAFVHWLLFFWQRAPISNPEQLPLLELADQMGEDFPLQDAPIAVQYYFTNESNLRLEQAEIIKQSTRNPFSFFRPKGFVDGINVQLWDIFSEKELVVFYPGFTPDDDLDHICCAQVVELFGNRLLVGLFPVQFSASEQAILEEEREKLKIFLGKERNNRALDSSGHIKPSTLRAHDDTLRVLFFEHLLKCFPEQEAEFIEESIEDPL